jgi:drug/metabolite transporter (DMT)-like permease
MYTCIKYFPIVVVNLVSNIAPLLIAVMSFFLYKVALSKLEVVILIVSFIGCIILITGAFSPEDGKTSEFSTEDLIIPSIFLVIVPINNACINLFLRQMRDMNEITLGSYIIYAMFLFYAPFTLAYYGVDFLYDFSQADWLICLMLGVSGAVLQIFKALSIKYEEPARLATLNYFQPII